MLTGSSLGPYRIEHELGAGGMGTVYRATGPEGVVALKVVHAHLVAGGDAIERFRREVAIGMAVDHPNVVRTLSDGESEGLHYLAMEYVVGQTLDGLLVELERVPEELCRHIGREVCKGLAAIHAKGAIHRDLKPENILITPDNVVKIMDLGVARSTDDALRLSRTGAFVGSLHYACPEQFTGGGKGLDGRVDLHALGLVLYELVSGVCPYLADDIPQTVRKVLHEEPRRLGEINPQLSPFFEEVVHCLLAKDRDRRFATAGELLLVLDTGEESSWWRERAGALQLATRRPVRRIRIPRETAVYGREAEIARLRALFEQARGGDGRVVLVEGEAGIGKSRLVDELVGALQMDGEDVNFLFGSYPPGGAATAEVGFSAAYREQFGAAGSAGYLPDNQILVPAFDALLRGEGAPKEAQELTKGSLQTCFVRATQALAAERTTVVLIDDLHFAPEEGRALFTSLAAAVPGHRVMLIGTARPGIAEQWLATLTRFEHAARLEVPRLGAKHLVGLLRDAFRSERLAEQLGVKIAAKSDGNPFFAFEIIRGLREGRFIAQKHDGTWASTRMIEEIEIPSSVLGLVNARVADLGEDERNLLEVAACCGYEFDPLLVGAVLEIGQIPLMRSLAQIERKHRLVRSAGRRFVFDHHQIQEALYAAMPELLREPYHAALGAALETRANAAAADPETLDGALCVELCEHYLIGDRGESALRYLPSAHRHLTRSYLHASAGELTERALGIPGLLTGVARAQALLRLNDALEPSARRSRQEECAREAWRLARDAGDDALLAKALRALGEVLRLTSRHEEAIEVLTQSLATAQACGDRGAEASAIGSLGAVLHARGEFAQAKEHFRRQMAIDREIGDRYGESSALSNLGIGLLSEGRFAEAKDTLERYLELCREMGNRRGESNATGNIGNVLYTQGDVAGARTHWERFLALAREIGDRAGEAIATGNLGNAMRTEGRFCEALERYEQHLALCRATGNRDGEAIALVNLGPTWLGLGDPARARAVLVEAVAHCREIGARYALGYGLLDLGHVADEQGDTEAALSFTTEAVDLRRAIGHRDGLADALFALADLRRRSGDVDAARAAAEESLSLAREQERPPQIALALALLACLPGAPGDAAAEAERALAAAGGSRQARWLLFLATGDREHLEQAARLRDAALNKVPEEFRAAMLENLRLDREITAARAGR